VFSLVLGVYPNLCLDVFHMSVNWTLAV
jgi:hypothetical protein